MSADENREVHVDEVTDLLNGKETAGAQVTGTGRAVLQDADEDLSRYMTGIDLIVSGNINFGMKTARYLLPDSPYSLSWTDKPSDPTPDPLPYPALTWWWNQARP
ncbi:hypothetical protein ACWGNM_12465 [Streptomyces sp. NPDC055796]